MNHDDALAEVLAGGLLSAEAALHLKQCPSCRRELQDLREVEGLLKAAAPQGGDSAWEARLLKRLGESSWDRGRFALRAAAALLLAASLVAGLYGAAAGSKFPGAGMAAALSGQAPSPAEFRTLLSAPEDSTSALLDLSGQVSEEMPLTPPASLLDEFGSTDWGGWNG
jgi:anti-sigma factor RsiW